MLLAPTNDRSDPSRSFSLCFITTSIRLDCSITLEALNPSISIGLGTRYTVLKNSQTFEVIAILSTTRTTHPFGCGGVGIAISCIQALLVLLKSHDAGLIQAIDVRYQSNEFRLSFVCGK